MEVAFRSNKLQRCYEKADQATRTWGPEIGQLYVRRITTLYEMHDFSEVFQQPSWRAHSLKGDREGQYAITLKAQWRLIITTSTNSAVTVEEVSNHYD